MSKKKDKIIKETNSFNFRIIILYQMRCVVSTIIINYIGSHGQFF